MESRINFTVYIILYKHEKGKSVRARPRGEINFKILFYRIQFTVECVYFCHIMCSKIKFFEKVEEKSTDTK